MARPTFKGYMDNIQLKTGKTLDDFWRVANEKRLVEHGKVVSKHSEMPNPRNGLIAPVARNEQ